MSQKNGNNVQPPVHGNNQDRMPHPEDAMPEEQHHGENTKSVQDARKIGQSNGAGRPPLMKK